VAFHRNLWFGRHFLLPDAFMAVGFFFMLSGFVVARAYTDKLIDGMGFADFLRRRAQRLYPLVILGVVLGAGIAVVKLNGHVGGLFVLDFVTTLGALPTPWERLSWQFDTPLWSLFFEVVINVVFGLFVLRGRWLIGLVGVSGLVYFAFSRAIFNGSPDETAQIGWNLLSVTFLFYLGVLLETLHHQRFFRKIRLGFLTGSGLLILSFMADLTPFGEAIRLFSVFLLYPVIIIGGANQEPGRLRKSADLLGELSYPLYVLHIPFLAMLSAGALALHLPKEPVTPLGIAFRLVAVLAMSFVALKAYDEPVRRWLARDVSDLPRGSGRSGNGRLAKRFRKGPRYPLSPRTGGSP
jgi:peptidoglycan/LPS O-acetylase OafA/YrhL